MSVISYYARLDEKQLDDLRRDPGLFWDLSQEADGAELMDLDKDWSVLSYLLSPKAREEHKYNAALHAALRHKRRGEALPDNAALDAAMRQEAQKLGFELVDANVLPDDPLLVAIEGRGPQEHRLPDIGYGAMVFDPKTVCELSASFAGTSIADLRRHFDVKAMEALDVAGIQWMQESPSVFDDILAPCFERLRSFFARAADARQYILVAQQ